MTNDFILYSYPMLCDPHNPIDLKITATYKITEDMCAKVTVIDELMPIFEGDRKMTLSCQDLDGIAKAIEDKIENNPDQYLSEDDALRWHLYYFKNRHVH